MFAFAWRMCILAVASVGLFAQSTPAGSAQATRTSGMIGLTEGQIARLNALNPGVAAPAVGVVCPAALKFWDAQGTLLKSTTVSVLPGKSAYLDLFGDRDLALIGDDRREIRATITIPPAVPSPSSTTPQPAPCRLIGTLEIIDAVSGKTQEVLGVPHTVPGTVVPSTTP